MRGDPALLDSSRRMIPRGVILAFTCTIPARATLQVDDDRVRITRWDFEPGASTGWHEHAMDYCVVMVLAGTLLVHDGQAETAVSLAAGDAYARPKGIQHDVKNGSDHPIAFVEIEMKTVRPPS